MNNYELFAAAVDREEAQKRMSALPESVISLNRCLLPANTNVFINDTQGDSFIFLAGLREIASDFGRNIEVWEGNYLTDELVTSLLRLPDLADRVLQPIPGCGEYVAEQLNNELRNQLGYALPVVSADQETGRPALVVDDVVKTGKTISKLLARPVFERKDTVYATWALAAVSQVDLDNKKEYRALDWMLWKNRLFAAVTYAGRGVSPLGLPVNSMSKLIEAGEKSESVIESLAQKYFGQSMYDAVDNLKITLRNYEI